MLIQLEHKFRSLLKDPFFFFVVIHSHLPIADGQEETSGWRTWVGINEVGKYLFSFSNPTAAGKRKIQCARSVHYTQESFSRL